MPARPPRSVTALTSGLLALLAVTALVGVCMVYLGAHWTTDVLAGWVLGAVIGAAQRLLAGTPTLATLGPISRVASYADVAAALRC